jgi:hypothetical protein
MKSSIRFLTGVALFGMMMASANAAVTCNGLNFCEGPANELMPGIFPIAAGGIVINSPALVDGLPCEGAKGGINVFLPPEHLNYKEIYAAFLTASVAEKDVQIRIDTEEAECTVLFARFLN